MSPPELQVEHPELKELAKEFAALSNWFRDLRNYSEITRTPDWPLSAHSSGAKKTYDDACDAMDETGNTGSKDSYDICVGLDEVHRTYTNVEAVSFVNVSGVYPWSKEGEDSKEGEGSSWYRALHDHTYTELHGNQCNPESCNIWTSDHLKNPAWAQALVGGQVLAGLAGVATAVLALRAGSRATAAYATFVLATDMFLCDVRSSAPFNGAAEIWAELGKGADSVGSDLQKLMNDFSSKWDGVAAEAFDAYTKRTLNPVIRGLGEFARSISDLLKRVALVIDGWNKHAIIALSAAAALLAGISFIPPLRVAGPIMVATNLLLVAYDRSHKMGTELAKLSGIMSAVNNAQRAVLSSAFGTNGKSLLTPDFRLPNDKTPDDNLRKDWHPAAAT